MNRILANMIGFLNLVAASAIIGTFTLYGTAITGHIGGFGPTAAIGALVGFAVGFVIAGLICGVISLLVLIERHLRTLATQRTPTLSSQTSRIEPSSTSRVEPFLSSSTTEAHRRSGRGCPTSRRGEDRDGSREGVGDRQAKRTTT